MNGYIAAYIAAQVEPDLAQHRDGIFGFNKHYASSDQIVVYLRLSWRILDGVKMRTLDVASVEVRTDLRGKGIFTSVVDQLQSIANSYGVALYVENILEPRLIPFFARKGYKALSMNLTGGMHCLYRTPE